MSSVAEKPATNQGPPKARYLATCHKIKAVKPESSTYGSPDGTARYRFLVTVTDGKGSFTARIEAAELMTFPKFRQALFHRYGCWFESDQFGYDGRKGKEDWNHDVAELRRAGESA